MLIVCKIFCIFVGGVSGVVVDDVRAGFLQPIVVVDAPSTVLLVRFNGMNVDRGIVLLDVNVVE